MKPVQVLFLGTGDAFCPQGRHHAGYLVRGTETSLLLDCGSTALASLKRERVRPAEIDAVLISHLHGDHFAGLPFLFLEYTYSEPRNRPLAVAGPPGTEQRVLDLYRAMYGGASARIPFDLRFVEMQSGVELLVAGITIKPFQVPHQEVEISLGLEICLDDIRILYSGDTGWTEDLVIRSRGTDLFICECSFYETRVLSHLDHAWLAENRRRLGTKRLILSHLGKEVLAHQSEIQMELAYDGLRVELGPPRSFRPD